MTQVRALLVGLVLIWAVSWPIIKIGVSGMPPIWFACLRYAIAAACGFAFMVMRGSLRWPAAQDWRFVVVSGVLQMGTYAALTAIALTRLPSGRASVLAYSTPLWVTPISAWWIGERVTRRGLAGVALGLIGVLIIASPALGLGQDRGVGPWSWHLLVPYVLLLGAAGAWAVTIVFVRAHAFLTSTAALAPWQMLVAALLLWPFAAGFEGGRPPLTIGAAAALCYVSPIATAFAYWAAVEIGRSVRATTMSMSLLAVPALGTLLSSIVLHEVISLSLLSGLGMIVAGICLVTARFSPRSLNRATIDWSALVLRAIVGVGFMAHGYAKVSRGPDAFAGILQALDVPLPLVMAWATILVELVGGFAILIGAYVRLASVPMAIVLLVAMFTVHLPYGFSSIKLVAVTSAGPQFGPPGYEVNLLYLACLAALVLGGSRRPRTSTQGR